MFDKRNGVRLGLDSDSVKTRLNRLEDLEKRRKAIGWHQGGDSRALLRASLKYFEDLCDVKEADSMRLESVKEAVPRLQKMLAVLEQEIADADEQIAMEKKAVEEERKSTMSGFLDGLSDPQLQAVSYEYCKR
jgi:chromosome segregation ATPase